jgi:hypothetical protein
VKEDEKRTEEGIPKASKQRGKGNKNDDFMALAIGLFLP